MSGIHFQEQTHSPAFGSGPIRRCSRSISGTERDRVFTPKRTMAPAAVVELQHDCLWWVGRINPAVSEQLIALANLQRRRSTGEEVLAHGVGFATSRLWCPHEPDDREPSRIPRDCCPLVSHRMEHRLQSRRSLHEPGQQPQCLHRDQHIYCCQSLVELFASRRDLLIVFRKLCGLFVRGDPDCRRSAGHSRPSLRQPMRCRRQRADKTPSAKPGRTYGHDRRRNTVSSP